MLAVACATPQPAGAYPCADGKPAVGPTRELAGISPDECRVPETLKRSGEPARERKTGDMSGLTVFVLAIAGALLIPIGRKGLPAGGDPFLENPSHDRPF